MTSSTNLTPTSPNVPQPPPVAPPSPTREQASVASSTPPNPPLQTTKSDDPSSPNANQEAPVTTKNYQAASSIKTKTVRTIKVFSGFLIVILLLNVYLIFLSFSSLRTLQNTKEQIVTTQDNTQSLESALEFLNQQQAQIDLITHALPNEPELVDFIRIIESVSSGHANASSLDFSVGSDPKGTGNEKYIPFTIKLTTDMPNFQEFLVELEKLPYIVQLTSIQANHLNPGSEIWDFTLAAKIYVRDPFKIRTK